MSQQSCNENALLRKQIELLEKQNNTLEAKVNGLRVTNESHIRIYTINGRYQEVDV